MNNNGLSREQVESLRVVPADTVRRCEDEGIGFVGCAKCDDALAAYVGGEVEQA